MTASPMTVKCTAYGGIGNMTCIPGLCLQTAVLNLELLLFLCAQPGLRLPGGRGRPRTHKCPWKPCYKAASTSAAMLRTRCDCEDGAGYLQYVDRVSPVKLEWRLVMTTRVTFSLSDDSTSKRELVSRRLSKLGRRRCTKHTPDGRRVSAESAG